MGPHEIVVAWQTPGAGAALGSGPDRLSATFNAKESGNGNAIDGGWGLAKTVKETSFAPLFQPQSAHCGIALFYRIESSNAFFSKYFVQFSFGRLHAVMRQRTTHDRISALSFV